MLPTPCALSLLLFLPQCRSYFLRYSLTSYILTCPPFNYLYKPSRWFSIQHLCEMLIQSFLYVLLLVIMLPSLSLTTMLLLCQALILSLSYTVFPVLLSQHPPLPVSSCSCFPLISFALRFHFFVQILILLFVLRCWLGWSCAVHFLFDLLSLFDRLDNVLAVPFFCILVCCFLPPLTSSNFIKDSLKSSQHCQISLCYLYLVVLHILNSTWKMFCS